MKCDAGRVVVLYMILMPSKVGAGETAIQAVMESNRIAETESVDCYGQKWLGYAAQIWPHTGSQSPAIIKAPRFAVIDILRHIGRSAFRGIGCRIGMDACLDWSGGGPLLAATVTNRQGDCGKESALIVAPKVAAG